MAATSAGCLSRSARVTARHTVDQRRPRCWRSGCSAVVGSATVTTITEPSRDRATCSTDRPAGRAHRPVADPGPAAGAAAGRRRHRWVRRGDGLVGWGVAAEVRTSGADRFADGPRLVARADARRAWSATRSRCPGTGLVVLRLLRLRRRARGQRAGRARGRRRPPRRHHAGSPRSAVGRHQPRRPRCAGHGDPQPPSRRDLHRRRAERHRRGSPGRRRGGPPHRGRGPGEGRAGPRPGRHRARGPIDVRWPLRRLAEQLPDVLDLPRRRAVRRHARDAGPP